MGQSSRGHNSPHSGKIPGLILNNGSELPVVAGNFLSSRAVGNTKSGTQGRNIVRCSTTSSDHYKLNVFPEQFRVGAAHVVSIQRSGVASNVTM